MSDSLLLTAELQNKIKNETSSWNDRFFRALEEKVHEALARQDSDLALAIITRGALEIGSSDIHYDMNESTILLRFRIDGRLAPILQLSLQEYRLLLERMKYKSELKLNITTIPQDGKYQINNENGRIDVRISTLPIKLGENVVCRVLDSTQSIPKIDELGFMWSAKRHIERSLQKNSGMILVTGPTGSGKTTTLYSIMQDFNTPERKIITLEDPVEYQLPGVIQSEVNEKQHYTYEVGLKALLRQDPDIIMVGEIRDLETANTAVQAAMTGHVVLSTLHTKSAGETLERLMNMGLPNYLLASSIDIIIAQRLVRKLCPHCIESYDADANQNEVIKWMMRDIGIEAVSKAKKNGFKLYKSTGCDACGGTGFKGRMGVFEVLTFTDEIRKMIREGSDPKSIIEQARKNDFMLMREDGVLKAMRGKTTLEELFRAVD